MDDFTNARYSLLGSLLDFTKFFFKARIGKEYAISQPVGRESHYITISKALTQVFEGKIKRLIINVPPRYGKTELLIHFVAWCLAHYPDSQFIYVSYGKTLATTQTSIIRQIIEHPYYQRYFGVGLSDTTNAKDNFETVSNGSVYAVGAAGSITGRGAGIFGVERFGGAIIIDDIIKPEDASSDVIRQSCNDWYFNTLLSRRNATDDTPIIFIGQRVHEDDLANLLLEGKDGHEWHQVVLPALDGDRNALCPTKHTVEQLETLEKFASYMFAAQMQQNPLPAGGGIFKVDYFFYHDDMPELICTFITIDTAETNKTFNDATVLSFWGYYAHSYKGKEMGTHGLIWLGCIECRVEPKDLEPTFLDFYGACANFKVPPQGIYIEKKSTGTYLISLLKQIPGLRVIEIERGSNAGSKTQRFLDCQPYVSRGAISFLRGDKHVKTCVDHMVKITANDTHMFDDICDTACDAINIALINKTLLVSKQSNEELANKVGDMFRKGR